MVEITNTSYAPISFREKPTKAEPEGRVVEIQPGATETVDIERDNVNVVAYANAKLISVPDEDDKAQRGRAKPGAAGAAGEGGTPAA